MRDLSGVPGLPTGLSLDLADGRRCVIRASDAVTEAVIDELGRVMRLQPGAGGYELHLAVRNEDLGTNAVTGEEGIVLLELDDPPTRDQKNSAMVQVSSRLARESLAHGGLLLHGALAEYKGSGFIMTGPSGAGKSTASRRLSPPWHSLCDDTTLVVRDREGRYWAHPWPTWSLFVNDGPGGSWPVEQAVPLRAVFFLTQSSSDRLEPIGSATQVAALLFASAENLTITATRLTRDDPASRALGCRLLEDGVAAARSLAAAVPAYSLQNSLDGSFWKEIERVLPVDPGLTGGSTRTRPRVEEGRAGLISNSPAVDDAPRPTNGSLRVVYFGPSMNPTLRVPDLLEVMPCGTDPVRPGDVVYYSSPEGREVVHRVISVTGPAPGKDGTARIRTRGDNNRLEDAYTLAPADIIGRVIAAQRGTRRRAIPGGRCGRTIALRARLIKRVRRYAGLTPQKLYGLITGLGPFDRLLPRYLRPRIAQFDVGYRQYLKLMMGNRMVGYYDTRRRVWYVNRFNRLFVDQRALPIADDRPVNNQ